MNLVFEEMPSAIASEQLPMTVEYLEKYKQTYGDYPEFLADLQELSDDAFNATIDPMGIKDIISMALQGEVADEENPLELMPQYYYEKLEDGYYLFSNGKDQLPFTEDDIVPDMTKVTGDNGVKIP
jgi:hypothetical protein